MITLSLVALLLVYPITIYGHNHQNHNDHNHHHHHNEKSEIHLDQKSIISNDWYSQRAQFSIGSPLDAFLPPVVGSCAYYTNLVPPFPVNTAEECAAACLNYTNPTTPSIQCIDFNVCYDSGRDVYLCGIQSYNQNWTLLNNMGDCSNYLRILPRNDTYIVPAVPFLVNIPNANITLSNGIFSNAFNTNLLYINRKTNYDDLLYPYRIRKNASYHGPGSIWAWDGFVPGSCLSGLLMSLGGINRWIKDDNISSTITLLVNGIQECVEDDGFAVGYPETMTNGNDNGDNQLPSYVNSWFTHGLLEIGTPQALTIARNFNSWWNNNTYLPQLFPMDGGDGHVGPAPNGYDPDHGTMSYAPFANGHLLYWMNQAGIGHTRMAMSSMGTQADIDFMEKLFREDWWLAMLIARNTSAIWARKWYPDNYEVTTLEAYLDLYTLTGNTTYLDAVFGGWEMFRDPINGWMFPGGSFALNENFVYLPGSYPLEYNGGGWAVNNRPTGELCPSAFWTKLNQRFHRLYPNNETFVMEMERSLINVGIAGQGFNGTGVRYFARLHKNKATPDFKGSCCEGQSGRLFGSIQEYIYSLIPNNQGVYINLYEASTFITPVTSSSTGETGLLNITIVTNWPYDSLVTIYITSSITLTPQDTFDIALRIPSWAIPPNGINYIPILLNNQPFSGQTNAIPGNYIHLAGNQITFTANNPSILSYNLSMSFTVHPYTGETQLLNYKRYAYTYGPFLLAAESTLSTAWNSTVDCLIINSQGSIDPMQPAQWLIPDTSNTNHLSFTIQNMPNFTFVSYFSINNAQELFTVFPIIT